MDTHQPRHDTFARTAKKNRKPGKVKHLGRVTIQWKNWEHALILREQFNAASASNTSNSSDN